MDTEILSSVWPEWSIVKQLGKGAYGTVYEAVRNDYTVESKAAIKMITIPANESEIASLRADGLSMDDTKSYLSGIVSDFVGEIQLMESFKGVQNIVSVEDYKVVEHTDRVGYTILIRMELLTPLNAFIGDDLLPEKAVAKLGVDICSALEICAMKNVIHRDIKPENIFINQFGDYKLGDFGVARKLENVAGSLSQKGTFNYMAPEIEKGARYNATVDIYSLGLVLYRFMNRKLLPFLTPRTQMSPNERTNAVRRRLSGEALPPPVDASPQMAEVILKACASNPADRFQSAKQMKQALTAVLNGTYVLGQAQKSAGSMAGAQTAQAGPGAYRGVQPGQARPGAQAGVQTGQAGPGAQTGVRPGQTGPSAQAGSYGPANTHAGYSNNANNTNAPGAMDDGLNKTVSVRRAPGADNGPQGTVPSRNMPQNNAPFNGQGPSGMPLDQGQGGLNPDSLNSTMSVRRAPGADPNMQGQGGMQRNQGSYPQGQWGPKQAPGNTRPMQGSNMTQAFAESHRQVGEFGQVPKKKSGFKKFLLIVAIVIGAIIMLNIILSVIDVVLFSSKDGDNTETTESTEVTATADAKGEETAKEEAATSPLRPIGETVLDPLREGLYDEEPASKPKKVKDSSQSSGSDLEIRDFDWFLNFMVAHGDEDFPSVDYIMRGDDLNGEWKCLISEGSDDENLSELTDFFNAPGILCTMDIDLAEDNSGIIMTYPYQVFEDLSSMSEDDRPPFSYDCSFSNMVLTANGDGDESFYVMFYRDGSAQRGFGSYMMPDGEEWGIMLTRDL